MSHRRTRARALWQVLHRFQYTELIMNLCEDSYDEALLRARLPETYLVHSKWPYYTPALREMLQWYWARQLNWPPKEEQGALMAAYAQPDNRSLLERRLCSSMPYKRLAMVNRPLEPCVDFCHKDERMRTASPKSCRLALEQRRVAKALPKGGKPYVWTSDLHYGPAACYAPLLREAGAELRAEISCPGKHSFHPSLCKRSLKVLGMDGYRQAFGLHPCPSLTRAAFFHAYKNDPALQRADLIICSYPAANCELYMPFNRSMLVYVTTRLEFGRHDELVPWRIKHMRRSSVGQWDLWVSNLKRIAARPGNVVAASNAYDVEYIKYHTGIEARYLPLWCGPAHEEGEVAEGEVTEEEATYAPRRWRPVLVGMVSDEAVLQLESSDDTHWTNASSDQFTAWDKPFLGGLLKAAERHRSQAFTFTGVYEPYLQGWGELTKHPALILIPNQVSARFFFQLYRTNTPIFAPSLRLLCEWVRLHGLLRGRVYGKPARLHAGPTSLADPNDLVHLGSWSNATGTWIEALYLRNKTAMYDGFSLEKWLGLCDWYHFKHVVLFDTWDDLMYKLAEANLEEISRSMATHNLKQRAVLVTQWREILNGAMDMRAERPQDRLWNGGGPSSDFSAAMRSLYGEAHGGVSNDVGCKVYSQRSEKNKEDWRCLSSDDALYYGCEMSFSFDNPKWTLHQDGDTALNCGYEKDAGVIGSMCPFSRPWCRGYDAKTGPTLGTCFESHWAHPGGLLLKARRHLSLPALITCAILVGLGHVRHPPLTCSCACAHSRRHASAHIPVQSHQVPALMRCTHAISPAGDGLRRLHSHATLLPRAMDAHEPDRTAPRASHPGASLARHSGTGLAGRMTSV